MRATAAPLLALLVAFAPAAGARSAVGGPMPVSGNGYGFAVVGPQGITRLYAHPYAYLRQDPARPLSEGVPCAQFLERLVWEPARSGGALAPMRPSMPDYLRQSHVVRLRAAAGESSAWMPFGLARAALAIRGPDGARTGGWRVRWAHAVAGRERVAQGDAWARLLRFEGVDEYLLLVPLDASTGPAAPGGAPGLPADDDLSGAGAWLLVVAGPAEDVHEALRDALQWRSGLSARALQEREISELERWRVPVPRSVHGAAARRVWRQGEIVLRMAQSREPNDDTHHGHGLIVAALPEGSWFTPWVRDMAYATVALARMGHLPEARAALLAWFDARPVGLMRAQLHEADYQVSVVRYFGNGAEEPWFTMEGASNVELDGWGLVLWALGEYLERAPGDALLAQASARGSVYESARDHVMRPLLTNLEARGDGRVVAADTSIWEEHPADARHFAYTSAAAIAGLRAFVRLATGVGDSTAAEQARAALAGLERGFPAAFVREGRLRGTLEPGDKNDIDGALLAIFDLGVADQRATMVDVVARMQSLKVASGGYRRVRSNYTDPAIFEYWYERQEFVFVDLLLSGTLRRLGRAADADALLRRIVDDADAHSGLVPEMYVAEPCKLFPGRLGEPTGAMPMAGYGAGALALQWLAMDETPGGAR